MAFKCRVEPKAKQFSELPDMKEVRRALMLFLDIDHFVFLQSLPSTSMACFPANEWDAIGAWVSTHSGERGLYFGINPVTDIRAQIENRRGSLVGDVVRRRWILIDIDRNKTVQPKDPATDNEHEDAKELAFEIMSYLSDIGFPTPAQVDSGNGFHLYYRVDMPNDTEHRDLVHDFLKLLDNTFSNEKGKVGHEVFDARRISRMPGTWSRRGDASKDRPYRQCKFVYTPIDGGVVPTELIRRVVSDDKAKETVNYTTEVETPVVKGASFKTKVTKRDKNDLSKPKNLRYQAAERYIKAGISIIPIRTGGSKAPALGEWTPFQTRLATEDELHEWFGDDAKVKGIATVCGAVSGNLELIDFDVDSERTFPQWETLVQEIMPGLLDKVHVTKTPRGFHVRYRCQTAVPGNKVLANLDHAKVENGPTVLIETRGEGGYALAPGSPPECHELHRDYHDRDDPMFGFLAEPITAEERSVLIDAARTFDEMQTEKEEPHTNGNGKHSSFKLPVGSTTNGERPSDDYNKRAEWHDILTPLGWKWVGNRGDVILWCRPGKERGVSATTGFCKSEMRGDLMKVFSSNASPLEAKAYSKFEAYTFLYCNGDFKKASAELGRKGFGQSSRQSESKSTNESKAVSESVTIRASLIKPRAVEWLWYGRIPLRKMTTFAGMGGIGKTFVLCDIASRVSNGLAWPFEDGECAKVGKVLYISGEDDPDDTLVPRMISCGANLENIFFMRMTSQDRFSLADIQTLDKAIEEMKEDVRLVVIDPPSSFLIGVDNHKDNEVRVLLTPLKNWVERNDVALIFNAHLNKGTSGKVDAMMRVMGSVAWVNAVRAAHLFAQDVDNPDKVVFVPMKMNLCKKRKGLGYTIASTDDLAKVQWIDEVDITANEAVGGGSRPQSRRENAAEWLIERFKEKLEWESEDLFKAAKHEDISRKGIFEAKKLLGLPKARKMVHLGGTSTWVWWVPEGWKPPEKMVPVKDDKSEEFEI